MFACQKFQEDYKYDVDKVLEFCIKNLNENTNAKNPYTYKGIINGYKQFDPTRGATYILDLKIYDSQLNQNIESYRQLYTVC